MSLEEPVPGLHQLLLMLVLLLLLLLLRAHGVGRGGRNVGGHLGLGLDGPRGGIRR